MKKALLVLASSVMLVGAMASCSSTKKETETKINFGFGYCTSMDTTTSGEVTYDRYNGTVIAAAFDADGKVLKARVDVNQVAMSVVDGAVTVKAGSDGSLSKQELGTDYGMHAYANTSEAYQQMEAWTTWAEGKTVEQIENNTDAITGCTIHTTAFVAALKKAYEAKYEVTVKATNDLKVGVGMTAASFSNAKTLCTYVAGALVEDSKVVTSYVDGLQAEFKVGETAETVVVDTTTKYSSTASEGQVLVSKRDLKEAYGMAGTSAVGEFYVHCQNMDAYVKGKTVAEVAAIAEEAEITGVTASTSELLAATKEAVAYSVKDVITNKPVEA